MFKKTSLAVLLFFLTGCSILPDIVEPIKEITSELSGLPSESPDSEEVFGELDKTLPDADNIVEHEKYEEYELYDLYIESRGYTPAKFEPESGCYAAAYIKEDLITGGSISRFEDLCRSNHAIYMIKNKLSEPFSPEHVLECVSLQKTPCIMLEPPEKGDIFDLDLLRAFIAQAEELDVPAFYIIYPYSSLLYKDSAAYKSFFMEASAILSESLENAAVIWSARCFDYDSAMEFYPGDEYVDWIAVSTPLNIQRTEGKYLDPVDGIDSFYDEFSGRKPMWLNLNISHYSTDDNVYYSEEKIGMLETLYERLENQYPRIKAVMYEDFNGISGGKGNNYLITEDVEILKAYAHLVNGTHFLPQAEANAGFTEYFLSGQDARVKDGEVYFHIESLMTELNLPPEAFENTKEIGGEAYITAADLISSVEFDFYQDTENSKIYLSYLGH